VNVSGGNASGLIGVFVSEPVHGRHGEIADVPGIFDAPIKYVSEAGVH
jgi:hypothetical protein